MIKSACLVNICITEDELKKLELTRTEDVLQDEDTFQDLCDCVEMSMNDVTLATCSRNNIMYEISTTCDRHNLYLFKSEYISDTDEFETVDAENISSELDEIKTYPDLCRFMVSQKYEH